MSIIIGTPVNPRGRFDIAKLIKNLMRDVKAGKAHRETFVISKIIVVDGDFAIETPRGVNLLSVGETSGNLTVRGGVSGNDGGTTYEETDHYVSYSLPFTITADPDLADLLHCRVQVAAAQTDFVSATNPTLNTDVMWDGFSSTDTAPFYYKVSGVLTAWPSTGVPLASWGNQGVCVVPTTALLASGTTYYARGWLHDGLVYSQCDDLVFVA